MDPHSAGQCGGLVSSAVVRASWPRAPSRGGQLVLAAGPQPSTCDRTILDVGVGVDAPFQRHTLVIESTTAGFPESEDPRWHLLSQEQDQQSARPIVY